MEGRIELCKSDAAIAKCLSLRKKMCILLLNKALFFPSSEIRELTININSMVFVLKS